jgi:Uma2 family endonuclease
MTTEAHQTRLTPEQYLELDRASSVKSEYVDGDMFAMAGASFRHSLIVTNLGGELRAQLRDRPCTVHTSDLRVATDPARHYTYPDVIVTCGSPQFIDDRFDTLTNPNVVAEVLSQSTENYDRGEKFERYRAVAALGEYILVAHDRVHLEVYSRQPDGSWLLRECSSMTDEFELASLGCRIKVAEVYAKVTFDR